MSEKSAETNWRIEDFEYELPDELVAQSPPEVRHGSRLMWVDRSRQSIEHRLFSELPDLLAAGDLLIINDTKVIPARLQARRQSGAVVEILLLRPESNRPGIWLAMASPLRKLREGEELLLLGGTERTVKVDSFMFAEDGQKRVYLDFGGQRAVYETLSEVGMAPLPPYIRRDGTDDERQPSDLSRYQTIYAKSPGAVAAPTAGLHFSDEIFENLRTRGVEVAHLTLHVGPGTFKPISTTVSDHVIESEQFSVQESVAAAIQKAKDENRRVIAVGTTSCRALETIGAGGRVKAQEGSTNLYIKPGFDFKVVDCLVTNFHLSRSSLLVLVSAFGGCDLTRSAYAEAVAHRYRFFSYGDAMLIT